MVAQVIGRPASIGTTGTKRGGASRAGTSNIPRQAVKVGRLFDPWTQLWTQTPRHARKLVGMKWRAGGH
jgi:hypothetical protein